MIRMEDAGARQALALRPRMALARRVGPALMDGKPVGALDRLRYALGKLFIYAPLRNTLGFSRVRVAYTAGEAIGPDLFIFYRSIGINLKQLYGSTETAVFVCLQPDHEVKLRHRRRADRGRRDQGRAERRDPGALARACSRSTTRTRRRPPRCSTADGWYRTGDAGFFDAGGPPEDHRPRQGRRPDRRRRQRRRPVRAQVRREQAQVLPLHQGGGGVRRPAREGLRVRQHRHARRSATGPSGATSRTAATPTSSQKPEVSTLIRECVAEGQRRPRRRREARRQPDQPLPDPAQGARRRRRRADPHAQGPPRLHRRALRRARRRALRRQERAVRRDRR